MGCGLLGLVVGAVVLALTFICLYAVVGIVAFTGTGVTEPPLGCMVGISAGLILLLFLDTVWARRDDSADPWKLAWQVVRGCLHIGPSLILGGGKLLWRAGRWARLDIRSCANLLSHLAAKNRSASKEELLQLFPEFVWPTITSQIGLLEGILFLRPDASRITLLEELRQELRRLLLLERQANASKPPPEPAPEPLPVNEPGRLSCYELLGVSPLSSLAEIKTAYRNRIKECHPDRFAGMGSETQQVAEEWSKALNGAYDALMAQRAQQQTRT
ncbi:MAG TPA: J domain-containing protein [Candidatus Sulfotelmatobacter sp.]|nr:J domain-containing protein [Candidatus Sulfotelmatobacter sp.]